MRNYNIKSFHLNRENIKVVCNIIKETESAYKVMIYDVQGCKFNLWFNGDIVTISKQLIKE